MMLKIKKRVRNTLLRLYLKLENSGNDNPVTNGEYYFIKRLTSYYADNKLCIFDVGANDGAYSHNLLKTINGRCTIHAFEPTRFSFSKLQHTFNATKNIVLNNFALSDTDGTSKIYYDAEGSESASLYQRNLAYREVLFDKSEDIELKRLDSYIASEKITKIHLLKLDTEGHELAVLQGMGSKLNTEFVDFIQFEYGGCNLDSKTKLQDLYEILGAAGFKLFKIMPTYLEPRKYSPMMENFIYANYVAISSKVNIPL